MRLRRGLAAAFLGLTLPVGAVAASAPASVPDVATVVVPSREAALDVQYQKMHEQALKALADARQGGDQERIDDLSALARTDRQLLHFSSAGDGQVVEVLGDLVRAQRIAILVPGADTRLDTFDGRGDRPWSAVGTAARALEAQAAEQDPDTPFAVVAWLGYDTPSTMSLDIATDAAAQRGAIELRRLVPALRDLADAEITLLCHSYGSIVCGRAAEGLPISDIVVYGSPGMGVDNAAALGTQATVWAGRGTGDWIRNVPNLQLPLGTATLGFGADPSTTSFGAQPFPALDAGHSDYLRPGSTSLRALTAIALGLGEALVHH